MSKLNDGEVSLTLGDRTYILRPTLNAIRTLSRMHGGLRPVIQVLVNQDFDGVVSIIKVGAGLSDKDQDDLAARVYAAGMNEDLITPVVNYYRALMNGGKTPADDVAPAAATEAAPEAEATPEPEAAPGNA